MLDNLNSANDESGHAKALLAGILDNNFQLGDQLDQIFDGSFDVHKPAAFFNYVLFDHDYNVVPGASGVVQAVGGTGAWNAISTAQDIAIEQNGYLLDYLSTQVTTDVYFDNLNIKLKSGNLLEETHYYPFGLPIHNLGTAAAQHKENRLKYQSNEYIEDNDLRWMNFNARQYDPQIGRFLSIDPLAYQYGQQIYSPYAAMGNNPGMMVDPNGTRSKYALDDLTNAELIDAKRGYILGTGFSSSNTGGLKVPFGMNNTMIEGYGGGGTLGIGAYHVYNFFKSIYGIQTSYINPSTGIPWQEDEGQTNDYNLKHLSSPIISDYNYLTDKKNVFFKEGIKINDNYIQLGSSCLPATIAYGISLYSNKEHSVLKISQEVDNKFKTNPLSKGIGSNINVEVMEMYFEIEKGLEFNLFSDYSNYINNGNAIISTLPDPKLPNGGHAVLIIGYDSYRKKLIYFDSSDSKIKSKIYEEFWKNFSYPILKLK